MKSLILTVLFLSTLVSICLSQEEVSVTTIRVWVAVEGAKGPLTEKDFEIKEDGKRMTPTCFEKVSFFPNPAESSVEISSTSDIPLGKKVAIFIDELNTSSAEVAFIKPKVLEFLKQIAGKAEVMLVAFPPYDPLVPYTKDADEIVTKLDEISGNRERDMKMTERRRRIELILEYCCPRPIMKATDLALQYQVEETQEVQLFLDSLKRFSDQLREQNQDEHTIVLLISGGINSRPGQQYFDVINSGLGNSEEELPLGGAGTTRFDVRRSLQKAVGKLNRDNVTIYTINTRGQIDPLDEIAHADRKYVPKNQKGYAEDYQNALDWIADETGGLSFRNSLNFKHGFDAILTDLGQQYLLCYVAPEHDDEGEYHKIEVKSKVRGTKLRHRAGYVD